MDWKYKHFVHEAIFNATPESVVEAARAVVGESLEGIGNTTDGFVARGFAGDVVHLAGLMKQAISRKGFSLIDILQPCVSFNFVNTSDWYRKRVYKLDEKDYDPNDRDKALLKAMEWGDQIPIGVIYKQDRASYEELLPALAKGPLVKQPMVDKRELQKLFTDFSIKE